MRVPAYHEVLCRDVVSGVSFLFAGQVSGRSYFRRIDINHRHRAAIDAAVKFVLIGVKSHIRLQNSGGFDRVEIGKIHKIIIENRIRLLEAWNGYFGS